MSAVAAEKVSMPPPQGPSLRVRIAAVTVLCALAALAAYAMFSGPTVVAVKLPLTSPTRASPPAGGHRDQGPESGGVERE